MSPCLLVAAAAGKFHTLDGLGFGHHGRKGKVWPQKSAQQTMYTMAAHTWVSKILVPDMALFACRLGPTRGSTLPGGFADDISSYHFRCTYFD